MEEIDEVDAGFARLDELYSKVDSGPLEIDFEEEINTTALILWIIGTKTLETLILVKPNEDVLKLLLREIKNCVHVKKLTLAMYDSKICSSKFLKNYLEKNTCLRSFFLNSENYSDFSPGLEQGLENNTRLKEISLGGFSFQESTMDLTNAITKSKVETVMLFPNEDWEALGDSFDEEKISENNSIRKITFDSYSIVNSRSLELFIKKMNNLNNLTLTDIEISDITPIIETLLTKSLNKLDLSSTYIGDTGATVLGNFLETDTNLDTLCISKCSVGYEGFKSLMNSLSKNSTLKSLDISDNSQKKESIECIGNYLKQNNTLETLTLEVTDHIDILLDALCTNTHLCEAFFTYCKVKNLSSLYRVLMENRSLRDLEITYPTKERIFRRVLEALEFNTTLLDFQLKNDQIQRYLKFNNNSFKIHEHFHFFKSALMEKNLDKNIFFKFQ
eukprot:gene8634-581_t